MHLSARYLDPRHSLAAAIGWLVLVLSVGLVLVASAWVDEVVHTDLLNLRGRHLGQAAEVIVDELNLNFALELQSVRALAAVLTTELRYENRANVQKLLDNLRRASPEFKRIAVVDTRGRMLAGTDGSSGDADPGWGARLLPALSGAGIGEVRVIPTAANIPPDAGAGATGTFVELAAPVIGAAGNAVGAIGVRLSKESLLKLSASLARQLEEREGAQAVLLDGQGAILLGPAGVQIKRLSNLLGSETAVVPLSAADAPDSGIVVPSHTVRLGDGRRYLLARAAPRRSDALRALGWRVVVLQPYQDAVGPARTLQTQITLILFGLGLLAALLGVLLARRFTRDLDAIARSADAVMTGAADRIAVPSGKSEAARLGLALDALLTSLQRERSELQSLNAQLDRRVAARARQIERLSEQARYAAVARERLKLARDLHDTLAHSMMAMLTEIRILRKQLPADPAAAAEELVHAEETARQGLKKVRAAIAQLRFNSVRDVGLAAALGDFAKMFTERTGIAVQYTSDVQAGTLADERADTLFRIAEESMRNIERHSGATRVVMSLRAPGECRGVELTITDDGVGFDVAVARPGHYGLVGLREQAQLIGATLSIDSVRQQGTTIRVTVAPETDA